MFTDLKTAIRPALVLTASFALLLGVLYPAVVTGIGQAAFPHQANGSLIHDNGRVIGSELLAQRFTGADYLHPRPSAAGKGYEADNSYGSNLGPTSQALVDRVKADIVAMQTTPGGNVPPADLVTTSASGLDPHISPEAALFQVQRIAAARSLPRAKVRKMVVDHIDRPLFGFLGEPRVNVLAFNRALDRTAGRP
jgi:K+-transporting ATPase ATPase C chain